ncbi:hypothetical protein GPN2_21627 [Streptomyces murinus]
MAETRVTDFTCPPEHCNRNPLRFNDCTG